ncbi:hypothetical protein [Deinococcus multiflagellatus]|nr:hypothetical protein [Deinococcus multiflagellatus]MBZ9715381.1 hypothetical protein [Deinococcus multiflagellatus]
MADSAAWVGAAIAAAAAVAGFLSWQQTRRSADADTAMVKLEKDRDERARRAEAHANSLRIDFTFPDAHRVFLRNLSPYRIDVLELKVQSDELEPLYRESQGDPEVWQGARVIDPGAAGCFLDGNSAGFAGDAFPVGLSSPVHARIKWRGDVYELTTVLERHEASFVSNHTQVTRNGMLISRPDDL